MQQKQKSRVPRQPNVVDVTMSGAERNKTASSRTRIVTTFIAVLFAVAICLTAVDSTSVGETVDDVSIRNETAVDDSAPIRTNPPEQPVIRLNEMKPAEITLPPSSQDVGIRTNRSTSQQLISTAATSVYTGAVISWAAIALFSRFQQH